MRKEMLPVTRFAEEERLGIAVQQHTRDLPVRFGRVESLNSSGLQLQPLHRSILIVDDEQRSLLVSAAADAADVLDSSFL